MARSPDEGLAVVGVERSSASNTYRYRDPEKRREYMRDLMRARRARG